MIMDKNLLVSSAQAITSSAASTDVIDMGVAADWGVDGRLRFHAVATEAFTASGSATLQVSIQGSADNSTFFDYAVTQAIPKADLTLGKRVIDTVLPPRPAGAALPRYFRLYYTVATGPMTAGKITAGIVLDGQNNHAYAPGIAISN